MFFFKCEEPLLEIAGKDVPDSKAVSACLVHVGRSYAL
ncbi:hypothetical protein SDC9_141499 [bioreactor metagenome]|uniref:Uncharacterized protein n=1 Tax=bioreactor metagenome TaxID=1076179 RepID=A0A645E0H1_9ZZZZ